VNEVYEALRVAASGARKVKEASRDAKALAGSEELPAILSTVIPILSIWAAWSALERHSAKQRLAAQEARRARQAETDEMDRSLFARCLPKRSTTGADDDDR